MTKFSQGAAISYNVASGLTPSALDFVVILVVGDGDVGVHEVSNLAQELVS